MNSRANPAIAVLFMILTAATAGAADRDRESFRTTREISNESGRPVTTSRDTLYLLGGPDRWDGRFEDPDGWPN